MSSVRPMLFSEQTMLLPMPILQPSDELPVSLTAFNLTPEVPGNECRCANLAHISEYTSHAISQYNYKRNKPNDYHQKIDVRRRCGRHAAGHRPCAGRTH